MKARPLSARPGQQSWGLARLATGLVALAFLGSACTGASEAAFPPGSSTTSDVAPGARTGPPPSATQAPQAPTTTTTTTTTTRLPVADITGFGATTAEWAASHHPDPQRPPGNYWPRLSDGKDTYSDVSFVGGRALSYTENLYPSVPASQALAIIGDELPPDAHVVSQTGAPSGERVIEASPTLQAATGAEVAVVMHSAGATFDPAGVTSLTYSAAAPSSG